MSTGITILEERRLAYQPKTPRLLHDIRPLKAVADGNPSEMHHASAGAFPLTGGQSVVHFKEGDTPSSRRTLRIGVVLSGGQAAGGHNVIVGIFDALNNRFPGSELIGFLDGPSGIIENRWKALEAHIIDRYRNMGGFDMVGAGRTKIETPQQFAAARKVVSELALDGLVIIGGDDSNTNAALLAEDFKSQGISTCVVGVPKTIDGDLKNQWIETSFGFDTACKTYSDTIASMARDALSAKKYYYFIKLMGRSASHITLECALQTQPNLALISEEIEASGKTLKDVVGMICDVIAERADVGKDYGVVLVPEGLLEFIPECKMLIRELNGLLAEQTPQAAELAALKDQREKVSYVSGILSEAARQCYQTLTVELQQQLILDRDPHGNVQVSKIETERLLMELARVELATRKAAGKYKGKFSPQPHFCGYEGRSCFPTDFDANYCYALGQTAALLVDAGLSGYMACVWRLTLPAEEWEIGGVPLVGMMHQEVRKGKVQNVIRKALIDLQGPVFRAFSNYRASWVAADAYLYPGPVQYFGPPALTEAVTKTLKLESIQKG